MFNVSGMYIVYWSQVKDFCVCFDYGEWVDQLLVFIGSDYYIGWVNVVMLKCVGIDVVWVCVLFEEQCNIIGYDVDVIFNGFFVDVGFDVVFVVLLVLSVEQMLEVGCSVVCYSNLLGLIVWMDLVVNGLLGDVLFSFRFDENIVGVLLVYQWLVKGGEFSVYVVVFLVVNLCSWLVDFEVLDKVCQCFFGSFNLILLGIKVFVDGVLEYLVQIVVFFEFYCNSRKMGELLIDLVYFGELVSVVDVYGWLVYVYVIGDCVVCEVLNGMQQVWCDCDSGIVYLIIYL